MKNYKVQEGDTPDGLAQTFQFKAWKNIYDHKANEALRAKRGPNEIQPGDVVIIPDAVVELTGGGPNALKASEKLELVPVIFDAHMHIMSANCTPFPVAYFTQLEPVINGIFGGKLNFLLSPASSRKLLNKVGSTWLVSLVQPFLSWSPRSTLRIGQDTIEQNDAVFNVFRASSKTYNLKHLRDCGNSFLGISIVLTMDMDLCHVDGYKGESVYSEYKPPGAKKPVYTYNVRLTGEVNERKDLGTAHPTEWGVFETWEEQVLNTKIACAQHPFRLVPMYHYEPRRYSVWTGQETSFEQASLSPKWSNPFKQLATKDQAGMFAGFKMYSPQGYQPTDPRIPSLAKFFAKCAEGDVPIMTHCTPSGHFTHERKLFIDLDPAAAAKLSQRDRDDNKDAAEKRNKYLDAKERHTKAEKAFDDYCREHGVLMDPFAYQTYSLLAPDMAGPPPPSDPEYWKAYSEYQDARAAFEETGEAYERAARVIRLHEDMPARLARAGGDSAKMAADPPLRLKYFKEKYLHPEAWRPLLEKHPKLRLCLAHFASDACIWWHYLKDEKGPCHDLDDVPYEKNWVQSIVELCTNPSYENFYVDLSYLPLMAPMVPFPSRSEKEAKALKKMEKKDELPLHWQSLAKACKQKGMLTKIMFGTDWYMILASKIGYAKWHKEALEGLALVEKELNLPRKVNLFYQFAVVNPMRFYRLPLIADNLMKGIEKFIESAPLSEEEKEEYFGKTSERMARNHDLLTRLVPVLEQVEKAPGDDKGILYEDQVSFVDVLANS